MSNVLLTEQRLKGLIRTALIISASIAMGLSLAMFPPYITLLLVLAVFWFFLAFKYPLLGPIAYILVILLRPGEVYNIPFVAKAAAGMCIVVLLIHFVQNRQFPKVSAAYKAMLFFIIAVGLSAVVGFWLEQIFEIWENMLKTLLLYTLIIVFVNNTKQLGAIGVTILSCIGYAGIYVILLTMTGGAMAGDRIHDLAWGMFGDSNEFAQIVVMIVPFLVLLLMEMKGLWWRIYFSTMTTIGMTIIVLSGSRGGFLGLAVVAMAIIWRGSRRRLLLTTLVILAIGSTLIFAPDKYFKRLETTTNYAEDESISGRLEAWTAGLRMFAHSPITGIGAGCFDEISENYGSTEGLVAHNSFITALAETGILGLLGFLLIIYFTYRGSLKIDENRKLLGKNSGLLYVLAKAVPISLLGYVVTAMFISTTYYPQLFMLSAVMSAGLKISENQVEKLQTTEV